jgi:hypothetical protein
MFLGWNVNICCFIKRFYFLKWSWLEVFQILLVTFSRNKAGFENLSQLVEASFFLVVKGFLMDREF